MNYKEFEPIFTRIYSDTKKQDEFLKSIPVSIRDAFFDNEYSNSLEMLKEFMMKKLFSTEITDDIMYFLYDWKSGYDIETNGNIYIIDDFEDMLIYFKKEYPSFQNLILLG